jgi:lysophosphatidylcholine acyltransferase / lyso-PAF acetyltransferase
METSHIHAIFWCLLYAAIGLLLFEFAWKQVKPLREVDEERDSKYPAFRRFDALNWKKWRFYPGAVLLLPLRMLLTAFCFLLCYLFTKIFTCGHDFRRGPLSGWRFTCMMASYRFCSFLLMNSLSMYSRRRKVKMDYAYYLG